jgi:uncharacterized RDD family membrane protein YckC
MQLYDKAQKPRSATLTKRTKALLAILTVVFIIAECAVTVSPLLLSCLQCPADAFDAGPSVSPIGLTTMLVLLNVCGGLIVNRYGRTISVAGTQTFVSAPRIMTPSRFSFLVMGILGLSAVIWLNSFESYYCISPNAVIRRSGVFNKSSSIDWNQSEHVLAECTINKKDDFKSGVL